MKLQNTKNLLIFGGLVFTLMTGFLFNAKTVFAAIPASAVGRVYLMNNGAKFPLANVAVAKQGYMGNWDGTPANYPACAANPSFSNQACWQDRVQFYSSLSPIWSDISNGAEYVIGQYSPTFSGSIVYYGDAAQCINSANGSSGWCGLNCGLNPNRWWAFLPFLYPISNFPSGFNLSKGHWVLHPDGNGIANPGDINGNNSSYNTYFYAFVGNDWNIQFNDFEWVPDKTCQVSLSSSSVTQGTSVTATAIGYSPLTSDSTRLYLSKLDGTAINPVPPGSTEAVYSGLYYYYLNTCNSNQTVCSASFAATLPAGNYRYHCDLPTDPGKCSGNPFCTYKGGTVSCTGWTSCAFNDNASLTVQSPPTINTATALQVKNAGTTSMAGIWGISGKQTTESGANWLNPMYIRQNATKGSGTLKLYATAFYDRKQGAASDQPVLTSLSAIESQIDADASRGFILAYAASTCANQSTNCPVDNKGGSFTAGRYYAYVRGSGGNNWVDITDAGAVGVIINDNYGQPILKVAPSTNGNYYGQWVVYYYQKFNTSSASKGMYTAGYIVDSNNLSNFTSNQNATLLP